jgi:integrating conjugative element protein (TIGR03765 family)
LYTPFFVLGMDEQSLTWFEDAVSALAEMNATGFIVQAHSRHKWASLQAYARDHGITVSLLNGDGLARMYGFSTYPTVFIPREGGQ